MVLVSTTQRCGSTWLVRILEAMTGSVSHYINGRELGFRLRGSNGVMAVAALEKEMRAQRGIRVFKTHDVPSCDFDAVCAAMPKVRVLTVSRDFKDVLVSRYFYYRYYWPTDAALGPLPGYLAKFFGRMGKMGDRAALARLAQSKILRNWAEEWAAFEGGFATARALRVTYRGLLDGSAHVALELFTGLACPRLESFQVMHQAETYETGRKARSRFHRAGRCGEWTRWLSPEQGAAIEAEASRTNIT